MVEHLVGIWNAAGVGQEPPHSKRCLNKDQKTRWRPTDRVNGTGLTFPSGRRSDQRSREIKHTNRQTKSISRKVNERFHRASGTCSSSGRTKTLNKKDDILSQKGKTKTCIDRMEEIIECRVFHFSFFSARSWDLWSNYKGPRPLRCEISAWTLEYDLFLLVGRILWLLVADWWWVRLWLVCWDGLSLYGSCGEITITE